MEINGITFTLTGETYEINRGLVYPASLVGHYTRSQVTKSLIGHRLNGRRIIGLDMFCIESQTNKPIGILVDIKGSE